MPPEPCTQAIQRTLAFQGKRTDLAHCATEVVGMLRIHKQSLVIGAEAESDTAERDFQDVAHAEWIQPIRARIALETREFASRATR
jgi:hypothetical protein